MARLEVSALLMMSNSCSRIADVLAVMPSNKRICGAAAAQPRFFSADRRRETNYSCNLRDAPALQLCHDASCIPRATKTGMIGSWKGE